NWKIVGYDEENRLQIGKFSDTDFLRDAIEFHPSLVINGESMIEGTGGWGLNPRTFIGQTQDLTTLICVIDGRRPGHSLGAVLSDCSELMLQYGAYQAQNLDGGSSSVMYYNGRVITKPSNLIQNGIGRKIPDAFIVT
ncbi:MAG: phosphodiester glycosidase family protein, partial [Clostridiaceae bacterium]|nr:phosphodiester glycosidase family protein [Clostridiaceae bacterium]